MKIFLDAGHNNNGFDTGASSNGLREQDITYAISHKVGNLLLGINKGIEIKYSRENITNNVGNSLNESINRRSFLANSWQANLFISFHCNAGGGVGTETLIYKRGGEAEKLAKSVQNEIINQLNLTNRGIKERTNLGVLKNTNMPSILIETAFIDNVTDAEILANKQNEIAYAIFQGICNYLGIEAKNGGENMTVEQALDKIISIGVETDKEFWVKACEYDTHLDKLLIKIAEKI